MPSGAWKREGAVKVPWSEENGAHGDGAALNAVTRTAYST